MLQTYTEPFPVMAVIEFQVDVYKRQKLLIAFLVATLLPLTLVALVSYHVSYNLARDRITNSALMSDEPVSYTHLDVYKRQPSDNEWPFLSCTHSHIP